MIKAVRSIVIAIALIGTVSATAQDAKDAYFATDRAAFERARTEKVDALSPRTFEQALSYLGEAEKDFDKGRKPTQIQAHLDQARKSLLDAQRFAALTRTELLSAVSARDDALQAQAPQYATDLWRSAASRFREAAEKIEKGDTEAAHRKASESEVLLRDCELAAIKVRVLGEARQLVAQAEQQKTADVAPQTLASAKRNLELAEEAISKSRYATNEPQQLAAQAVYDAHHALYLRQLISSLLQRDAIKQHALEQTMLDWERALRRVAVALNIEPRFDNGYGATVQAVVDRLDEDRRELSSVRQLLHDRDDQIALLNAQINQLQSRLGGESRERQDLQKRLSAQERIRDNVARIEGMFTSEEGRVFREGSSLTLSLTAIAFRVGKSTIEPDAFPVLEKVGEALKLFPTAMLVVEGHTDGQGNESAMLLLSQDRADAVRQYLIDNLRVDAERVTAVGYGKQRPIAPNDTEAGRSRNRRIDIVMKLDSP